MNRTELSTELSASPQLSVSDVSAVKAAGFRSIICNRPDGEVPDQPPFSAIAGEASRHGIEARHIPFPSGQMTDADVAAFRAAAAEVPRPILGYCASGRRVATVARRRA